MITFFSVCVSEEVYLVVDFPEAQVPFSRFPGVRNNCYSFCWQSQKKFKFAGYPWFGSLPDSTIIRYRKEVCCLNCLINCNGRSILRFWYKSLYCLFIKFRNHMKSIQCQPLSISMSSPSVLFEACAVCGGPPSSRRFGALACFRCNVFFRNMLLNKRNIRCSKNPECEIGISEQQ